MDLVLRRGDERAFGALYDRHSAALFRLALRLLGGDDAAAADAVHDAWVAATPRLGTFAWRSSLRTWLCGFVVHQARRHWRDQDAPPAAVAEDIPDPAPFEPQLVARIDLDRALVALPPGARAVLVLHDLEGWTHMEIADQLGIAPGTSKSQLARARALLRVRFARSEPPGGA